MKDKLYSYRCPICTNKYYDKYCDHVTEDLLSYFELITSNEYELEYTINKLKDQIRTLNNIRELDKNSRYNIIIKGL